VRTSFHQDKAGEVYSMKSPSWMYSATADNSGHTATLRYAKIQHSRTSHVRKTLDDIAGEDYG